jgi:hypothetical protein
MNSPPVEKGATVIELTCATAEIVALRLARRHNPRAAPARLSDWMGTGAGFTLAPGASLDDPTFAPEEWEDVPADDS